MITNGVEFLIAKHPFLSGIEPKYRAFLGGCGSIRRFASNQVVFQEGGDADHFYLILSGEITLKASVPGDGLVTVQLLHEGDVLGWSWLFAPYVWHFTAITLKPTEVISLDARTLRQKGAEDREFNSDLVTRIARTLYQRLLSARNQLIQNHPQRL